jgi:mono/diheme cytochrome c family protein
MPAFHLTAGERAELLAFLAEVDRTGTGQARAPTLREPRALLEDLVRGGATESDALTPEEERGLALVTEQNCIDCHLPNATSAYRAADLTLAHERLGAAGIAQTLQRGVPGKAMPVMPFDETDRAAVVALLARLGRHGDAIRGGFDSAAAAASGTFASLPWFEYPRPAAAAGARR